MTCVISAEDDELFWKLSCVAIEKQTSLWTNENSMEKLALTNVQYSTIDGLLLMHVSNKSNYFFLRNYTSNINNK